MMDWDLNADDDLQYIARNATRTFLELFLSILLKSRVVGGIEKENCR